MVSQVFNKKLTGIIGYITVIGWLIAYLFGDVAGAKFHLNQALVLGIAELILSVVAGIFGGLLFILGLIFWILDVALFIFAVLGIISAVKEEENPLPFIGGIKIL